MFIREPYLKIEPASAAIIMTIGIFLIGPIEAFPILNIHLGKILAFILLISWIIIYGLLSYQFFHVDFLVPFIKNPINSFAMGTWIAGVSVLCNVFLDYFPKMINLIQVIALLNSLLWVLFFLMSIYNFKKLLFNNQNYSVHGTLLLSTVATQSILILLNNVFMQLPIAFSQAVIIIGLVFYLIELLRAQSRIKKYGWSKGVFTYHVTQWSRNFTFGMFYTFTYIMLKNSNYVLSEKLYNFQSIIIGVWAWVVLITLMIEIIIFIKHFLLNRNFNIKFQ